jgi:peptidoglycan hydrolase-like protein with peptidoglycan-binding domain
MRGQDVAFVQRFIGAKLAGPDDGIFGPRTEAAVRWYQRMRGLAVDGLVGPATWAAMGRRS